MATARSAKRNSKTRSAPAAPTSRRPTTSSTSWTPMAMVRSASSELSSALKGSEAGRPSSPRASGGASGSGDGAHQQSEQRRRQPAQLRSTAAGAAGASTHVGHQQRRLDHDVTDLCRRLEGDDDIARGDDGIQHCDVVLQSDRADDPARGAGDFIPGHPVAFAQRLKGTSPIGRGRIAMTMRSGCGVTACR